MRPCTTRPLGNRRRLPAWVLLALAVTPLWAESNSQPAEESAWPAIRDTLDTGHWQAARDSLLHMAAAAGQEGGSDALGQVGLGGLTALGTERLLAGALLHFDVYLEARKQREYLASTYAREMYLVYLRQIEQADTVPKDTLAELYALLGDELHNAGLLRFSVAVFKDAVRLAPKNVPFRLSLAIQLEQMGLDSEAAGLYAALLNEEPHHEEAALRQALVLRRLGRIAPAHKALEALVDEAQEPWVLAVAYQELAEIRLRQDGPTAARQLLSRAIERLPDQPQLYLQLAFVLDTQGHHAAASEVLDNMKKLRADNSISPRHRMARWTSETDPDRLERLRHLADERLATLQGGAP